MEGQASKGSKQYAEGGKQPAGSSWEMPKGGLKAGATRFFVNPILKDRYFGNENLSSRPSENTGFLRLRMSAGLSESAETRMGMAMVESQ